MGVKSFGVRDASRSGWAQENDEEEEEEEEKSPKKAKKKKGSKQTTKKGVASKKLVNKKNASQKKKTDSGPYKAGEYSTLRMQFIRKLQKSQSVSYTDASTAWNESEERAGLLAGMSQAELKRRRFV